MFIESTLDEFVLKHNPALRLVLHLLKLHLLDQLLLLLKQVHPHHCLVLEGHWLGLVPQACDFEELEYHCAV